MAKFRCVNYDGHTLWLDIEKVMYLSQPDKEDDPNQTIIKLVTGEFMTLDENYEELLEDWGILTLNI